MRWGDRSPEYAAVTEQTAHTVSLRTAGLAAGGALLAGSLLSGTAGVAIGTATADPPVVVRPLPLAESCATAIRAAETALTAVAQTEDDEAALDAAVTVYLDAVTRGDAEDIDAAAEDLADAKVSLAEVEGTYSEAAHDFRDANNSCVTHVERTSGELP